MPNRNCLRSKTNFDNWKLFENDEKCFEFDLKIFLFLRHLIFCLCVLVMQKNSLIREIRVISRFMTLQPWKQTIPIYALSHISRSQEIRQLNLTSFVCQPGYNIIDFVIHLIFLIKLLFSTWPKRQYKILNSLRTMK